jgi:hypothetical protein
MRCAPSVAAAALVATTLAAAEPSPEPNPMLVSPYFPSVFVSCVGFGRPPYDVEKRSRRNAPPRDLLVNRSAGAAPELSWAPGSGDHVWLKLLNNTRGTVYVDTDGRYPSKLPEEAAVHIQFMEHKESGALLSGALYDLHGTISIPSDQSVVFSVPREAFKDRRYITVAFRYDWEAAESAVVPPVTHEVVLSSQVLPPDTRQ